MLQYITTILFLAGGWQPASVPPEDQYSIDRLADEAVAQLIQLRQRSDVSEEYVDELFKRLGQLQLNRHRVAAAQETLSQIRGSQETEELSMRIACRMAAHGDIAACREMIDFVSRQQRNDNSVREWIVECALCTLCDHARFRDAIRMAMGEEGIDRQTKLLAVVALRAAAERSESIVNVLVPRLSVKDACDAHLVTAEASIDEGGNRSAIDAHISQAAVLVSQIEPPSERWLLLNRISVCRERLGQPLIAQEAMEQIDDTDQRAWCAMKRAAELARQLRFVECERLIGIARHLSPSLSVLVVVKAAAETKAFEDALRLMSTWCPPEERDGTMREAILLVAMKHGEFDWSVTAGSLLSTPRSRAQSLLDCANWFLSSSAVRDDRRFHALLTAAEYSAAQIEDVAIRCKTDTDLARLWRLVGETSRAKTILRRTSGDVISVLATSQPAEHQWDVLFPLLDQLQAAGLPDEKDVVLSACGLILSMEWEIKHLCDSGKHRDAIFLAQELSNDKVASYLESILRRAASAGDFEWAIDQSVNLAEKPLFRIERLLVILEEVDERFKHRREEQDTKGVQ